MIWVIVGGSIAGVVALVVVVAQAMHCEYSSTHVHVLLVHGIQDHSFCFHYNRKKKRRLLNVHANETLYCTKKEHLNIAVITILIMHYTPKG